jgi:hypothetical protein
MLCLSSSKVLGLFKYTLSSFQEKGEECHWPVWFNVAFKMNVGLSRNVDPMAVMAHDTSASTFLSVNSASFVTRTPPSTARWNQKMRSSLAVSFFSWTCVVLYGLRCNYSAFEVSVFLV